MLDEEDEIKRWVEDEQLGVDMPLKYNIASISCLGIIWFFVVTLIVSSGILFFPSLYNNNLDNFLFYLILNILIVYIGSIFAFYIFFKIIEKIFHLVNERQENKQEFNDDILDEKIH